MFGEEPLLGIGEEYDLPLERDVPADASRRQPHQDRRRGGRVVQGESDRQGEPTRFGLEMEKERHPL